MNLPGYLITTLSLLSWISPGSELQFGQPCNELNVELEITAEPSTSLANKVVLHFESSDYQNFRLFLFSGNNDGNRLDFIGKEITNLQKGNYTLVIQDKNNQFCPKQFKFKIN